MLPVCANVAAGSSARNASTAKLMLGALRDDIIVSFTLLMRWTLPPLLGPGNSPDGLKAVITEPEDSEWILAGENAAQPENCYRLLRPLCMVAIIHETVCAK
jgi:hypothetical protein